eukprot:scaffold2700_cov388-Prasinococcus_capsulatus_cf.AAC.1
MESRTYPSRTGAPYDLFLTQLWHAQSMAGSARQQEQSGATCPRGPLSRPLAHNLHNPVARNTKPRSVTAQDSIAHTSGSMRTRLCLQHIALMYGAVRRKLWRGMVGNR